MNPIRYPSSRMAALLQTDRGSLLVTRAFFANFPDRSAFQVLARNIEYLINNHRFFSTVFYAGCNKTKDQSAVS